MAHIPHDKVLPQDMVEIYDHGDPDERKKGDRPVKLRMHVSDARHAMDKEPERYLLEPRAEKKPEPARMVPRGRFTKAEDE